MHGTLVRALIPEEPAWEGTTRETHIHPAHGLPIWEPWGTSPWGWLRVVKHCGRCQAVASTLLETDSQNSAGQGHEQPGLNLQLARLSAKGYFRCHHSGCPFQLLSPSLYPFFSLFLLLPIFLLFLSSKWK